MRRAKTIYILLVVICLMWGCTGGQYNQVLDRAEHQNITYDSITHIDSIQMAAAYMDRHGTANEQVRAYYLLGCAYRDAEEAPMALEAYHDAADRADTTRSDCDYHLLMRLHAQTADLLYQQLLPYEMMEELERQQHYARLSGDKKAVVNAFERRANAYYLLDRPDSIIAIRQEASRQYQQLGLTAEAARALGPIIDLLLDRGDTAEARRCINRYEAEAGVFERGEPISRKSLYYYSKGHYFLTVGKIDSAQVLFRRLLQPERTPQQQEAGYKGLYQLYERIGQKDSMSKYAFLCYQQSIPQVALSNADHMRHIQALYNYSRSQRQAQEMTDKARRQERVLYVVGFLAVALLIGAVVGWMHLRQKRQKLWRKYEQEQYNLSKAQAELAKLKEIVVKNDSRIKELMEGKEQDIRTHQEKIRTLEEKLAIRRTKSVNEILMETPAYQRVKAVLANPKDRMTQKDWQDLVQMMDEVIPAFRSQMKVEEHKLSSVEYQFCLLVRLYLSPKEISVLTGYTSSGTSMKRYRLLKKVFDIEGSAETFDKLIRQIE